MENEQIKPIPPVQPSSSPAQSSPSSGSTVASPSTSPSAQAVNTTPAQVVPTSPIKTKVRLRMPSNFPWLKVAGAILLVILALLAWVSLVDVSVSSNPQADEILINGKPANKTSFVRMPGSFTVTIKKEGYLTYEKRFSVSFNGTLDITPVLKPLPVAEFIAQDTTSDLVVGVSGGIKTLSTDSQYITWFRQKSGNDKSFERTNLNQSPLPGISSVQYPDKQNFALVLRGSEVGVLDFATPDTSSQDYTIFSSENIGPIALSHSGIEVFYWQYNPELDKSFLVRNNPTGTKPDRYFDQALIDQLDINKPVISWSKDDKYVLMVDEHIVLVSLVERTAKIIRYEKGISKAQLTPNNQTIIATSKSGELLTVNLLSEEDTPTPEVHDIRVLNDNFQTMDDETIYFLNDEKQLIEYNFARKEKIVYLIDSQLTIDDDATIAIDSANQLVYFWSKGEIFKQALVSEQYE